MVAAATRYSGGGADGIYSELFEGVGMGSEAAACAAHLLEPGGMCTPCARHVQCACHVRVRACMCMCVHVHVHAHAHVHACTRCAALDLGLGGAADGWSATGRTWVLDPIDGTKGFLRGDQYAVCIAANALRAHVHRTARAHGPRPTAHYTRPHYTRPTTHGACTRRYAICLSLLDGGRPVVGLLGCPNLSPTDARASAAVGCARGGTLAWAVRGGGAFASAALQEPRLPEAATRERYRRPTCVSAAVAPARVVRCEAFEAAHSSRGKAAAMAAALGLSAAPVRMDGQGKYAVLARGEAQLFTRLPRAGYRENIWDVAAGRPRGMHTCAWACARACACNMRACVQAPCSSRRPAVASLTLMACRSTFPAARSPDLYPTARTY